VSVALVTIITVQLTGVTDANTNIGNFPPPWAVLSTPHADTQSIPPILVSKIGISQAGWLELSAKTINMMVLSTAPTSICEIALG